MTEADRHLPRHRNWNSCGAAIASAWQQLVYALFAVWHCLPAVQVSRMLHQKLGLKQDLDTQPTMTCVQTVLLACERWVLSAVCYIACRALVR